MKALLLTLLLAAPLLAEELTQPPSSGGGISPGDVGLIIGAAFAAYIVYGRGKANALRVQGEIKELKDYATRDELETLRRDVYGDINLLTTELGAIKGFTSEIKGRLEKIDKTQQQILDHIIGKQP